MRGHWLKVKGVVDKGYGVASGDSKLRDFPQGTIRTQIPYFKQLGLDLSGFYPATLNINIRPKILIMVRPRYTFRWVKWLPDYPAEDFSFSPSFIKFKYHKYDCFIYYPHPETKLGHRHPPYVLEIIAPLIHGIYCGVPVDLHLNSEEVALLYSNETT